MHVKPRITCLLVALCAAGPVLAQSSVTLSGVVDLAVRHNRNEKSVTSLASDGNSSSRVAFQSVEDLGGGLGAGAWLELGFNPDTGNTNATFFNRRSLLRLFHTSYGELRMGRDYVPTHWNPTLFDPFVANGVGALYNLVSPLNSQGVFVSANNSIQYFLPEGLGGVYGMAMYALPEGGNGKYQGLRLGWRNSTFNLAAQAAVSADAKNAKYRTASVGGSWDFQVAKLLIDLDRRSYGASEQRLWSIGTQVPVGAGQIRASLTQTRIDGGVLGGNSARQLALGYVYNLSKRTALYTTAAHISNDGPGAAGRALFNTNGTAASAGSPLAGQGSTGFEVGVRHNF